MKLFQKLLVAPAALGLMAPVSVNAADLNIKGVSNSSANSVEIQNFSDVHPTDWTFQALVDLAERNACAVETPNSSMTRYEAAVLVNKCLGNVAVAEVKENEWRLLNEFGPELAVIRGHIDGLKSHVAEYEAGIFSSTTKMTGSAFFTTGAVGDGGSTDDDDELYMQYAYGMDLSSSFTGEDLLYVGIETGNASGPLAGMDSAVTGDGSITLHSLFYAFPLGDGFDVTVGPLVDQDDVVSATTSAYSDAFRLGSMPFSLAGKETGPGVAIAYSGDNGFVASLSYISDDGDVSTQGIWAEDGDDVTTFTVGYNGDGFGGGLVIASNDGDGSGDGYQTLGGGIYFNPWSIPATFSVAFDSADPDLGDEATDLFFGIDYEVGPGTLSAAYNSTNVDGDGSTDTTGFELSYSFPINDYITVTPGFFTLGENDSGDDDTGVVLETKFSF